MKIIPVHFDMETADPDDLMALCLIIGHPSLQLVSVSVTPGTDEQVGLVREVLLRAGHDRVPIGSARPGYDKNCVSGFYYRWLNSFPVQKPDGLGLEIIESSLAANLELNLITGAPLKNPGGLPEHLTLERWVGQGGFAGDNLVAPEHRLEKFDGMETCPTFNFNGGPMEAENLLAHPGIKRRLLLSKNVCHGVVYDQALHDKVEAHKQDNIGLTMMYQGMQVYLERRPQGKKFHDPLAVCAAIDESVCEYREVEMYRQRGGWGGRPVEGSNTFISVAFNRERFEDVLLMR